MGFEEWGQVKENPHGKDRGQDEMEWQRQGAG